MADTLVDRLTGAAASRPAPDPTRWASQRVEPAPEPEAGVAVEVQLVITDDSLLAGGNTPALLTDNDASGSNPAASLIPAPVARDLVRDADQVWLRRLYVRPQTGQLVAMESTRRVFDGNLRRMLILRDGTCRTPWCDAPIRHGDHITDAADGGPTSYTNGQGLCERCNHTKTLPGWRADVLDTTPGRHAVRTTTPTGHTYDSTAPPLLPSPRPASPTARPPRCSYVSPVESRMASPVAARRPWHELVLT
jgi:hypothetical protein